MIRIFASHPSYPKLEQLQMLLLAATNRAPRTVFADMPEQERLDFIDDTLSVISAEHTAVSQHPSNFLN